MANKPSTVHITVDKDDEVVVHRERQLTESDRDPLGFGHVVDAFHQTTERIADAIWSKDDDD